MSSHPYEKVTFHEPGKGNYVSVFALWGSTTGEFSLKTKRFFTDIPFYEAFLLSIEVRILQRVTNCVLLRDNQVLLLQKPRRGWWVAPGGKMEPGESVRDSCIREYREETGIYLKNPQLKGIFTFIMQENDQVLFEWMMFTFIAVDSDGLHLDVSEEGKLKWHPIDQISSLPMAAGDYHILDYMIHGKGIIYGTFTYTKDFKLLGYRLDPS